jgi:hypothetical protein
MMGSLRNRVFQDYGLITSADAEKRLSSGLESVLFWIDGCGCVDGMKKQNPPKRVRIQVIIFVF